MTYPEIQPDEIKAGDLIRWENPRASEAIPSARMTALEFIAMEDGHRWRAWGTHRLVNRPTPLVDLPKTRTLGWLSWRDDLAVCDTTELGMWRSTGGPTVTDKDTGVPIKMLTAFVPATAVPTEALDELRDAQAVAFATAGTDKKNGMRQRAIRNFLAAVDEAQS